MNSWLFLSLLLGHVIADFYLQNDKYCSQKEEKKFRSCFLYVHSLLVAVVSWALVPVSDFGFYALTIALSHLAIDLVKAYCPKGLWSFVLDQAAHLAILLLWLPSLISPLNCLYNLWIIPGTSPCLYSYWRYCCASNPPMS